VKIGQGKNYALREINLFTKCIANPRAVKAPKIVNTRGSAPRAESVTVVVIGVTKAITSVASIIFFISASLDRLTS